MHAHNDYYKFDHFLMVPNPINFLMYFGRLFKSISIRNAKVNRIYFSYYIVKPSFLRSYQ